MTRYASGIYTLRNRAANPNLQIYFLDNQRYTLAPDTIVTVNVTNNLLAETNAYFYVEKIGQNNNQIITAGYYGG